MELIFKRYFWTVRLAFIGVAAFLLMRVGNTFVGSAIEPKPALAEPPRASFAPPPQQTMVDLVKFGHLFGIDPPPPPLTPDASTLVPENTAICYDCAPVKTNLRLQLIATMAANQKQWSMALITDLDKQQTAYYVVGDLIKNAKIWDILREPQRVIIVNDDTHKLEYIDAVPGSGGSAVNTAGLGNLGSSPLPSPEPTPEGAMVAANESEGVKQLSENQYTISKTKLDSTLSNLNEVATQARIVPSFKNGVANGFKLFSIRPGSIYSSIGVQNGDVITRINGYDINSPDKALEVYSRLKDARNVEIDIERRGSIIKKRYGIE